MMNNDGQIELDYQFMIEKFYIGQIHYPQKGNAYVDLLIKLPSVRISKKSLDKNKVSDKNFPHGSKVMVKVTGIGGHKGKNPYSNGDLLELIFS